MCPATGDELVTSVKSSNALEPPVIVIVFVAPEPEAVTAEPTKFNVVAAVATVSYTHLRAHET